MRQLLTFVLLFVFAVPVVTHASTSAYADATAGSSRATAHARTEHTDVTSTATADTERTSAQSEGAKARATVVNHTASARAEVMPVSAEQRTAVINTTEAASALEPQHSEAPPSNELPAAVSNAMEVPTPSPVSTTTVKRFGYLLGAIAILLLIDTCLLIALLVIHLQSHERHQRF